MIAPLVVALHVTSGAAHIALCVFSAYYGYTRFAQIGFDWWTIRYRANRSGITIRTGLISTVLHEVSWGSVSALSATDSVDSRIARCREVRISVVAASGREIVLPGVTVREVARLERLYAAADGAFASPIPVAPIGTTGATVPSKARLNEAVQSDALTSPLRARDHLVIGLRSGRFLLVVPALFGLCQQIASVRGATISIGTVLEIGATWPWGGVLALTTTTLILGSAYGTFLSWIRYRRYRVSVRAGVLSFSAGLMRRERRSMAINGVAAIICTQDISLRTVRRMRVRCIAPGSSGGLTNGMLLPIATPDGARTAVRSISGVACDHPRDRSSPLGPLFVVSAAIVAAIGLGAIGYPGSAAIALVFVLFATVAWRLSDRFRGRIHRVVAEGEDWLVIHRGQRTVQDWFIRVGALDTVTFRGDPAGRSPFSILTIALRGSRTHRIRIRGATLRDLCATREVSVAMEQGRRRWALLS